MSCPTGKRIFDSKAIAEEALIQNHIRNGYQQVQQGPTNIYECSDCGMWHFTSKGGVHPMFSDEETLNRIKRENAAFNWERRLR